MGDEVDREFLAALQAKAAEKAALEEHKDEGLGLTNTTMQVVRTSIQELDRQFKQFDNGSSIELVQTATHKPLPVKGAIVVRTSSTPQKFWNITVQGHDIKLSPSGEMLSVETFKKRLSELIVASL